MRKKLLTTWILATSIAAAYDAPMPIKISGRVVFLASPGNMARERAVCRKLIRDFNEQLGEAEQVTFLLRAWEDMPGGVGRPQERINPKLDDCDFMILVLGDRWGSPPATDGLYSSGTEEEFHRCLDLLAQPDGIMRDLLVLFETLDPERLRDPGPQLLKVMNFRDSLEKSKALQYVSYDSDESFGAAIGKKLAEWARPLELRIPIRITLPETEDFAELTSRATREQILTVARGHAAKGLLMQAEAAFAHAIKDGDLEALSEFALFMRRTGRLERALELNRQIIDDPKVLSATDQDSIAHIVKALANMGVIYRKRGSLTESIGALREAVRTAESSDTPVYRELCYALDNYGLSLLRVGKEVLANTEFEKSHILRKEFGSERDLAQSAANLGRQALVLGDFQRAMTYFLQSLEFPDVASDDHLFANVMCGLAEARLRQGSLEGVRDFVDRALEINISLGNSDGISIGHALLARYFLLERSLSLAQENADLCRQESEKSGSATGLGNAALLLAMIALADGRMLDAREGLVQAAQYAQKSGNNSLKKEVDDGLRELSRGSLDE